MSIKQGKSSVDGYEEKIRIAENEIIEIRTQSHIIKSKRREDKFKRVFYGFIIFFCGFLAFAFLAMLIDNKNDNNHPFMAVFWIVVVIFLVRRYKNKITSIERSNFELQMAEQKIQKLIGDCSDWKAKKRESILNANDSMGAMQADFSDKDTLGKKSNNGDDSLLEKKCHFCGETILAVAIKCKHCGSNLTKNNNDSDEDVSDWDDDHLNVDNSLWSSLSEGFMGLALLGAIIYLIFKIGFWIFGSSTDAGKESQAMADACKNATNQHNCLIDANVEANNKAFLLMVEGCEDSDIKCISDKTTDSKYDECGKMNGLDALTCVKKNK